VLVLAGLVLVFTSGMRVEAIASANQLAARQAEAVARGAVQYVVAHLDGCEGVAPSAEEMPCEEMLVGDGAFWILLPNLDDVSSTQADLGARAFGLVDEASRVNLNAATPDVLLRLPDMSAELAASIKDWRDDDDEVTEGGAESEYYLLEADPYYCKNAPFETVAELLLVRDATRSLLFGEDANRNGVLDPNENDGDESEPADNHDGHLDRGWLPCVTVYSIEPNTSASGETRINVNQPASERELADVVRSVVPQDRYFQTIEQARHGRPYGNVLDFCVRSGLTRKEFARIADRLTTTSQRDLVGMINVNTASRSVLLCLPGIEEEDVDAIMAHRSLPDTDLSTIAWVAEALPADKAAEVGGHITTRSYQFSADIVALSGDGRAYRRWYVVVDARKSPPAIVYFRDLTRLGWPLDPEIRSARRAAAEEG